MSLGVLVFFMNQKEILRVRGGFEKVVQKCFFRDKPFFCPTALKWIFFQGQVKILKRAMELGLHYVWYFHPLKSPLHLATQKNAVNHNFPAEDWPVGAS